MAVHVGSLPRPHCTPAITNVNHIKIINIISLCQKGLEKKNSYRFSPLLYKSTRNEINFPTVFPALRAVKNTGHVLSKTRRALATLVAQLFSCPNGEHRFIRQRAHWQLFCCGNRKVAACCGLTHS